MPCPATAISFFALLLAHTGPARGSETALRPSPAAGTGLSREERALASGRALLAEGKFAEAVAELERRSRAVPGPSRRCGSLPRRTPVSRILRPRRPTSVFSAAAPGDVRALLDLAQVHWRSGRFEEGNRILETLVTQPPPKPKLGLEYARSLMQQSRFVQAERHFKRACGIALVRRRDALALWADALLENGRFEEAVVRYREAVSKAPDQVAPRHRLGRLLLLVGDAAAREKGARGGREPRTGRSGRDARPRPRPGGGRRHRPSRSLLPRRAEARP